MTTTPTMTLPTIRRPLAERRARHGRIRFGRRTRRRAQRGPVALFNRLLEACLLAGIVVMLAASVVGAH